MSRNYKFYNPQGLYFVSFAVVNWLDVFTQNIYKEIFLESLRFSQKEKGMEVISWCIMTNHVHLIFRSTKGIKPELLLGDLKRFTSMSIVKAIKERQNEGRNEYFLHEFSKSALKASNVKRLQFWQHDNKPIELWSNKVIFEKINYIHNNPVKSGLVFRPEDYKYSSAIDYSGDQGLLEDVVVFEYYG